MTVPTVRGSMLRMAASSFSMTIRGMHCGGCVRRVSKALEHIEGVRVESVEVGSATGHMDSSACSESELLDAVSALGFEAEITVRTAE